MADAVLFFRCHFGKRTAVFIFKERVVSERAAAALLKRDTAGAFAADDLCGLERGSDRDAADKAGSALISRYIGKVLQQQCIIVIVLRLIFSLFYLSYS